MDKVAKIVYSQWFLPCVVFIVFSLVVIFAGPYIAFAEYYPLVELSKRIMVIVFALLIYTIVQFFKYHKTLKVQRSMVTDLTGDEGVAEVIDAEKQALKEKFELALHSLKHKKGGAQALTELPWYMIIGTPGCGKTTLLSNSGLQFPLFNELSNQAVQGIGGTKNCDWWITEEAILLDTAGRYASQDSHQKADESGWKNFLGLIKRYRRKPISGLLVSFSMSDLLTMNDFEIGQQLIQMKQRVAELNNFFNTRFPVYIIVTKCDMLAGFTQYYESFSPQEREQTFGITFDYNNKQVTARQQFTSQFSQLINALTRRQWQRTSLERDASRKSLIYSFANQFSSLQSTIENIVKSLSEQDDEYTKGIVRGVYFTSGTQNGAPIDRMMAKVATTFGLKNTAQVLWNNDTRSYFIKDLLQKVVFPESDRFGVLAGYQKRQSRIAKFSMVGAGVFGLLLSAAWLFSYNNNLGYINSSKTALENWQQSYPQSSSSKDIKGYLQALNDFSSAVSTLSEQGQNEFSGLGLSQISSLGAAFNASYNRLITTALLPYLKQKIEQELATSPDAEQQYQALKAYLMMAQSEQRDPRFLSTWLNAHLNKQQTFSEQEYLQLMVHIGHAVKQGMTFDDYDDSLVENAQQQLRRASLTQVYYRQFKSKFIGSTENMLSMTQLAGADWRNVFVTSKDDLLTVSTLFTPAMFSKVKGSDFPTYLDELQSNAWVLGSGYQLNKGLLFDELMHAYSRDYVKSWQGVLDSITIKQFANNANAESGLTTAGAIDSPLLNLLTNVSRNTRLVGSEQTDKLLDSASARASKNAKVAKVAEQLENINIETPSLFITRQFNKLHELTANDRKTLVQQRLSGITSQLALALSMPNEDDNSDTALNQLRTFSFSQPSPLKEWGAQLASSVITVLNLGHKLQLAKMWQEDNVPQCVNTVSGKYPFDKNTTRDATLVELADLFADSGNIHLFFQQHIKPLVNTNVTPWRWKTGVQDAYQFDANVLGFFERSDQIRRNLYPSGGTSPRMTLNLKPIYLDSKVAKFKMAVWGNQLSYQFGRPITSRIAWPPENATQGASFSFVRRDGSEVSVRGEGVFGLFRLIDQSLVNRINDNKVEITFSTENYQAIYELSADGRNDPLLLAKLSQFSCLTKL